MERRKVHFSFFPKRKPFVETNISAFLLLSSFSLFPSPLIQKQNKNVSPRTISRVISIVPTVPSRSGRIVDISTGARNGEEGGRREGGGGGGTGAGAGKKTYRYTCICVCDNVRMCVYMDVCINDTRTDENNTFAWYGVRAATVRGEASRRWFCPYDALPPVALTPPPRRLPSPTVEDHPGPRSLGWFTLKPSGTYLRHPRDSLSSLPFGSCLLPLPLFPCPFLFRSASLPFLSLSLSLFDPPLSIVPRSCSRSCSSSGMFSFFNNSFKLK